jgi:MFS family permease
MDRTNIANARLEGLEEQLGLKGNQYNTVLTVWFVSYCVFESLSNILMTRFRPSRWIPGIVVLWGFVMTMMGLVKNFQQIVALRFLLGLTEASLYPGIAFYLTCWYPRSKLQARIGWFLGSASLAGAFSGLLAYAVGFMSGDGGHLGWSWIFILEGAATVAVGLVAFLIMVDSPETANFLTQEERAFVTYKQKAEYTSVGEDERFELRYIWSTVTDWQLYIHILIYWSLTTPFYGFSLFLPTIINSLGYSGPVSQLLTIPPYVLATILLFICGHYSEKWRVRSPFLYFGIICGMIGITINLLNVAPGVKYFGIFWVIGGIFAAVPGVVAWLGNNLSGHYKRGIGMALQVGLGNLSGTFASNAYRAQDAPRYILGHSIGMMFLGIGLVCVTTTVIAYRTINRRRDKTLQGLLDRGEKLSAEEIRKQGDKSPVFRYMI